jgi:hypothetical protein
MHELAHHIAALRIQDIQEIFRGHVSLLKTALRSFARIVT